MKMYPNYISRDSSNAEKYLYSQFSSTAIEGWTCLHSLGLSRHISKREGEIDFLLIGPEGIFVIEAKGGRVERENGVWKFIDRFGHISVKKESPFVQARSALYSLRAELAQQFGDEINGYVFGYGVAFPDIEFTTQSPEWDAQVVYDSRNRPLPMKKFTDALTSHWQGRQKRFSRISEGQINRFLEYLRGDFESVRSISLDIEDAEKEILELTQEQLSCLDALEQNDRVIFSGAAGTGKTVLAFEKIRRNEERGVKTLFLCFNRLLADRLKACLKSELRPKNVEIYSFYSFLHHVIYASGKSSELALLSNGKQEDEIYGEIIPRLFKDSWKPEQMYEELIIDEAQDIIAYNYYEILNSLVQNGLDKGKWSIFIDPENQKDIFVKMEKNLFEKLTDSAAVYKLNINCRNTKPIVTQAEIITGLKFPGVRKIDGLPVKYIWYKSNTDQAEQVSQTIKKLISDGARPQDIVILSPKRYSSSVAGSGMLRIERSCYLLDSETISRPDIGNIGYASIAAFKGLESPVVILTDIERLDSSWNQIINYVGFTRARGVLVVSMPEYLKDEYVKLAFPDNSTKV